MAANTEQFESIRRALETTKRETLLNEPKAVTVFLDSGCVQVGIVGPLLGGDLPGQPYYVQVGGNWSANNGQAQVCFHPSDVYKIEYGAAGRNTIITLRKKD